MDAEGLIEVDRQVSRLARDLHVILVDGFGNASEVTPRLALADRLGRSPLLQFRCMVEGWSVSDLVREIY